VGEPVPSILNKEIECDLQQWKFPKALIGWSILLKSEALRLLRHVQTKSPRYSRLVSGNLSLDYIKQINLNAKFGPECENTARRQKGGLTYH
jgi:hypothetical protein